MLKYKTLGFLPLLATFSSTAMSAPMIDLSPTDKHFSGATALSKDGSVIVGVGNENINNNGLHAVKYTETSGMIDLGTLGGLSSYAVGVSADGSIIAGHSYLVNYDDQHAFKYTDESGMVDLAIAPNQKIGLGVSYRQANYKSNRDGLSANLGYTVQF